VLSVQSWEPGRSRDQVAIGPDHRSGRTGKPSARGRKRSTALASEDSITCIDTRLIESFLCVVDQGSMAAAARRLHLTPAASPSASRRWSRRSAPLCWCAPDGRAAHRSRRRDPLQSPQLRAGGRELRTLAAARGRNPYLRRFDGAHRSAAGRAGCPAEGERDNADVTQRQNGLKCPARTTNPAMVATVKIDLALSLPRAAAASQGACARPSAGGRASLRRRRSCHAPRWRRRSARAPRSCDGPAPALRESPAAAPK
jgi:hypothetical protein